jgi:hypothetical protein
MRFVMLTVLILQTIFIFILLNKLNKHLFIYSDIKSTYYYGCTRGLFIGNMKGDVAICERDATNFSDILKAIIDSE